MFKFHRNITLDRLDKFTSTDMYSDVNLMSIQYKKTSQQSVKLQAYKVPNLLRISFEEAKAGKYEPAKVGDQYGPSWATVWFIVDIQVPKEWTKDDCVVLRWNSNSEAMVWSEDGRCLQGLTGGQRDARYEYLLKGERRLYIEMSCNGMFGAALGTDINPPNADRYFKLDTCELALVNTRARQIYYKFKTIKGMARELNSTETQRGADALKAANGIVNVMRTEDESTWEAAEKIADKFLSVENHPEVHTVTTVGHCHIDSAWLWNYAECKRKVARSWSTQVELMDRYPEYKFACSQALQYEWVKDSYPELFARIQAKVKSGQFIPVGGSWCEFDGNLPSGESFVRQILYGQNFFKQHFGLRATTFWLPDTFGYAAQLPQIMSQGGCKNFLTQKLSWNNINKFPHTTFWWHGLDNTRVLTHFPPEDTYNSSASVREVAFGVRNHKDKEHSNTHMSLIGYGDGGGGPTQEMLESVRTMKSVNGLPNVEFGTPDGFFDELRQNSVDLVSWKSELYFELHRGTYTSQSKNKLGNRKTEFLLRDVEYLAVLATFENFGYPKDELDRLWKSAMLQQFHDVLPGSSIRLVYDDSDEAYHQILTSGSSLKEKGFQVLLKKVFVPNKKPSKFELQESLELFDMCCGNFILRGLLQKLLKSPVALAVVNTLQYDRCEVVEVDIPSEVKPSELPFVQTAFGKNKGYVLADCKGFAVSVCPFKPTATTQVVAKQAGQDFVLENELVTATFSASGRLKSLFDKINNREVIENGKEGNKLVIHPDQALFWQAWDVECYHLEHTIECGTGSVKIVENGPLKASIQISHQLTKTSSMIQIISLSYGSPRLDFENEVDWNESHKILKVQFPFNIMSDVATYETPYGHVQRPTHFNTSQDFAKFEVCGHKFADISEFGYGVALLNDCKYGYSTKGSLMCLSLLRSPKAPDDSCDIGHHQFKYALYPHKGAFLESDVVQQGLKFNVPLLTRIIPKPDDFGKESQQVAPSTFQVSCDNVVLDAVKKAEDSGAIVVRFYESLGGRGVCQLKTALPVKSVKMCNVLEDELSDLQVKEGFISFEYKPFQIVTLKLIL